MAKKTVGFVELEWTCPNCSSKNPGLKKSCGTCGAPQPDKVQFELGQKRDLISEAAKAEAAAKGADIHCPYCGTRNPADAQACVQCGGDLKEGTQRESGKVLEAPATAPGGQIKCPSCATDNPAASNTCSACGALLHAPTAVPTSSPAAGTGKPGFFRPWMALPVVAVLLLCCVVIGFFLFRTEALSGVVQTVAWQRLIQIQEQREVTRETWKDEVPAGSKVISCQQEFRKKQDNPAPNAKEVCATAYVDRGNGAAEVVETCYYEVYADYCKYSAQEWQNVDQATAQGADLSPAWPQVDLTNGQREGDREENYTVYFETSAGVKEYKPADEASFVQFQPGSQWTLSVNTFGQVVEASH